MHQDKPKLSALLPTMLPKFAAEKTSIKALLPGDHARSSEECRLRNDRLSYFNIVRQLVNAQFVLSDQELATRLWQDIYDRDLDLGRITHLLYCCSVHDDDEVMRFEDDKYLSLID